MFLAEAVVNIVVKKAFICLYLNMPGENCSIYSCTVSRRSKYKGIALFKVPSGDTEFDKCWRDQLVNIIIKDREIDAALRDRIWPKILFICQRHFRED